MNTNRLVIPVSRILIASTMLAGTCVAADLAVTGNAMVLGTPTVPPSVQISQNPAGGGFTGLLLGVTQISGGAGTIQGIKSSGTAGGDILMNINGGAVGMGVGMTAGAAKANLQIDAGGYAAFGLGLDGPNAWYLTKEFAGSFNIWQGPFAGATNRFNISPAGNIGIGAAATTSKLTVGGSILASQVSVGASEANARLAIDNNGVMSWGSGTAAPDTSLYRDSANSLTANATLSLVRSDGLGTIGMNRRTADGSSPNATRHRWQITYNMPGADLWRLEHFDASGAFINVPLAVDAAGDLSSASAINIIRADGLGAIGMNRRTADGSSPNTTRHRWQMTYNLPGSDLWRLEHFDASGAIINVPLAVNATGDLTVDRQMIIGTDPSGTGLLRVGGGADIKGTVRTKEVVVTLNGWADGVFAADYRLPSLPEVDTYIQTHQHLPNVPSEAKIIQTGVAVGDMQRIQMAKIEELTLYAIEADHVRTRMQATIEAQQAQLAQQQAQIDAILLRLKSIH